MSVAVDVLKSDQSYEARGVVMRAENIGHFDEGKIRTPIYRYVSLDCGPGKPGICVEFVKQAAWVQTPEGKFLDVGQLKIGEIIISPGFIYKKIPWSSALMAAHLKALQYYRPKDIMISEKADAPAIDLGVIKAPTTIQ